MFSPCEIRSVARLPEAREKKERKEEEKRRKRGGMKNNDHFQVAVANNHVHESSFKKTSIMMKP